MKSDSVRKRKRQGKGVAQAQESRDPDASEAMRRVEVEGGLMDALDPLCLVGNVRDAPVVAEQPEVQITEWRFSRQWNASTVLLGFPSNSLSLRATSPVVCVNGRRVTTSSGRQYLLVGEPATSAGVLIAMAAFLATRGQRLCDVTADVMTAVVEGLGSRNLH